MEIIFLSFLYLIKIERGAHVFYYTSYVISYDEVSYFYAINEKLKPYQ